MPQLRPAIFLDRDGTLNVDKGYVHDWQSWEWLPCAREGLAALKKAGYVLVVASNQSGIARGYYDAAALARLNELINRDLAPFGACIDAFYHCPHHPAITGSCSCRKPAPGMIIRAAEELGLDLAASWLFGDRAADVAAALAAGVSPILLETGYGAKEKAICPPVAPVCKNFSEAVRIALEKKLPLKQGD